MYTLCIYLLLSRDAIQKKASNAVNASIWNALAVGEEHDDAVCAVNPRDNGSESPDRSLSPGRRRRWRSPLSTVATRRKNDYYFSAKIRLIKRSVNVAHARVAIPGAAIPRYAAYRDALGRASRRRMIERRVISNRPYIARESPSIIRIPSCQFLDVEQEAKEVSDLGAHFQLLFCRTSYRTCVTRATENCKTIYFSIIFWTWMLFEKKFIFPNSNS